MNLSKTEEEEELFQPLSKIGHKQFFINKTKLYFRPLKSKWFWISVIPAAIFMTYLEVVHKISFFSL